MESNVKHDVGLRLKESEARRKRLEKEVDEQKQEITRWQEELNKHTLNNEERVKSKARILVLEEKIRDLESKPSSDTHLEEKNQDLSFKVIELEGVISSHVSEIDLLRSQFEKEWALLKQ